MRLTTCPRSLHGEVVYGTRTAAASANGSINPTTPPSPISGILSPSSADRIAEELTSSPKHQLTTWLKHRQESLRSWRYINDQIMAHIRRFITALVPIRNFHNSKLAQYKVSLVVLRSDCRRCWELTGRVLPSSPRSLTGHPGVLD